MLAPPPFDALYDPDDIPIRFYDEEAYRTRSAYDRRRADAHAHARPVARAGAPDVGRLYGAGGLRRPRDGAAALRPAPPGAGREHDHPVFRRPRQVVGRVGRHRKGLLSTARSGACPLSWPVRASSNRARSITDICELIDTGRTLLALAGLEAPQTYRGRDLLNEPAPEAVYAQIGWPDLDAPLFQRAFVERVSEVQSTRGLPPTPRRACPPTRRCASPCARARYRMDVTWYQDGRRLPRPEADGNLFDLQADPYETRNLWAVPEAQPVVEELWLKLETGSPAWIAPSSCSLPRIRGKLEQIL